MIDEIRAGIAYRLTRIEIYKETFTDWRSWLKELEADIELIDGNHEDCFSEEYISENYVAIEEHEELKTELSDRKADIEVYRERLKQGVTHARLAEDFIFNPDDARSAFQVITGGKR